MRSRAEFASEYERTPEGWIKFPRDRTWVREVMPEKAREHPARNNLYLLKSIVEYVAEPGETILDPFAGVGSLIPTAPDNFLVLIEIEEPFVELAREAARMSNHQRTVVLQGDCRQLLPVPCHHAIFSPPFASDISKSTWKPKATRENIKQYGQSEANNLSRLNRFFFSRAMKKVYGLLAASVTKTLTIILRDVMREGERQPLSIEAIRGLREAGFSLHAWQKRYTWVSSRRAYAKSRGWSTVDDEDILIFER